MTLATLHANRRRAEAGFTLLEMMLALAIFAGLSMAGMQLLQGGIRTTDDTRQKSAELIALQKSFWILEQDLSQIVTLTSASGGESRTLTLTRQAQDASLSIRFLRRRSPMPVEDNLSSGLIQVEWLWRQGKLIRRSWLYGKNDDHPGIQMLDKVSNFDVSLITLSEDKSRPAAIRIVLDTPSYGEIVHTTLLTGTL